MQPAVHLDADFEAPRHKVRVFIVDDHRVVAESVAVVLNSQPDMVAIGFATSTEMAGQVDGLAPDLLVMDLGSNDPTGVALAQTSQLFPGVSLVVLSQEDSDAAAIAALEVGASAFIQKSHPVDELIETLRRVARGEMVYNPPQSIRRLLEKRRQINAAIASVSPREKEVLQFMAKGMASRQIAQELGIGYTTVRAHVHGLLQKLGAHSKLEAVHTGRQIGLVE